MKKLLVSLSVLAVSGVFASGAFAAPDTGGCQALGKATANGAPWGQNTKENNSKPGPPGIIASNVHGAHATLCP